MTDVRRAARRRIAILVVSILVGGPLLFVGCQGVQTLNVLTRVERERDQWQRPSEILQPLNLTAGSVVVDLGCGSGYFALKLSPLVGARGAVLAEDIRRESLAFLWIRRFLRDARNIRVIHGDVDDPRLPTISVDAVLIANTYHELSRPRALLDVLFHALKSGGRLVIVDRGPRTDAEVPRALLSEHHEQRPAAVESEIRQAGFDIVTRTDRFINRSGEDDIWWLMVARKP